MLWPTPASPDCLSHLSLAVKTASALLACDRVAPVESLLPECAKIAAEVEQRTASGAADCVKALLAYYCFRIRFSLVNDNVALAHWAVHKSQDLLEHNDIPHRDVRRFLLPRAPVSVIRSHLMLLSTGHADDLLCEQRHVHRSSRARQKRC